MHAHGTRIGMLYPTPNCGEDDYVALAKRISPTISIGVEYVEWPGGWDAAHDVDVDGKLHVLRELGAKERLAVAAEKLRAFRPDVATWACTSGSFLHQLTGARVQASLVGDRLGVPASSTSLAFLAGAVAMGASRVGLCSVYHRAVTDEFIEFLAEGGVHTLHRIDLGANSDRDLATWSHSRILEMVDSIDTSGTDAILIPETALHTSPLLETLEQRARKPVLTATQVTLWHALHQLGRYEPRAGLGSLFTLPVP